MRLDGLREISPVMTTAAFLPEESRNDDAETDKSRVRGGRPG